MAKGSLAKTEMGIEGYKAKPTNVDSGIGQFFID